MSTSNNVYNNMHTRTEGVFSMQLKSSKISANHPNLPSVREETRESFETCLDASTCKTCSYGLTVGILLAGVALAVLLTLWLHETSTNSSTTTVTSETNPCFNGRFWNTTGMIYAGTGTSGSALNELKNPTGLYMDLNDNLYITDQGNCRIMTYACNANSGTMVAGTGICGANLTQLSSVSRYLYVDSARNIYVNDLNNYRVMRWASGNSIGTIVAGDGTSGSALSQINYPYGLWVDSNSNIFVAESSNHRVTKWVSGSSAGIIVAGTGTSSSSLNTLHTPTGIFYDEQNQDLYISNNGASTVLKWRVGAPNGTIVAGIMGSIGFSQNQLNDSTGITVDPWKNLYVNDRANNRIQLFCYGNLTGITIAGQGSGGAAFSNSYAIQLDSRQNLYVAEYNRARVLKFNKL